MALEWTKVVDCPDVPDCDCPEPGTAPTFEGQTAWTACGGSSSSESPSSVDSSSVNPDCVGGYCIYGINNTNPDGSGDWFWQNMSGNGEGWRQAPCYTGLCPCQEPSISASDARDEYGTGVSFYAVDCSNGAILWAA